MPRRGDEHLATLVHRDSAILHQEKCLAIITEELADDPHHHKWMIETDHLRNIDLPLTAYVNGIPDHLHLEEDPEDTIKRMRKTIWVTGRMSTVLDTLRTPGLLDIHLSHDLFVKVNSPAMS
jgi:hypothetical protein